jgi:hypothetical protein
MAGKYSGLPSKRRAPVRDTGAQSFERKIVFLLGLNFV